VRFSGRHLYVNADIPQDGELRVEVLDREGRVIPPFTMAAATPVRGNGTRAHVMWSTAADLSAVSGQTVRLRFHVTRGSLYAFWVSPSANGASHGYVAGGGPEFSGPSDDH
jgi:hypothetical protein